MLTQHGVLANSCPRAEPLFRLVQLGLRPILQAKPTFPRRTDAQSVVKAFPLHLANCHDAWLHLACTCPSGSYPVVLGESRSPDYTPVDFDSVNVAQGSGGWTDPSANVAEGGSRHDLGDGPAPGDGPLGQEMVVCLPGFRAYRLGANALLEIVGRMDEKSTPFGVGARVQHPLNSVARPRAALEAGQLPPWARSGGSTLQTIWSQSDTDLSQVMGSRERSTAIGEGMKTNATYKNNLKSRVMSGESRRNLGKSTSNLALISHFRGIAEATNNRHGNDVKRTLKTISEEPIQNKEYFSMKEKQEFFQIRIKTRRSHGILAAIYKDEMNYILLTVIIL
ncbi:unnamed protein product [Protopolystoma xenopodis]|uniref:Uncharacterized protein n=1 Tax=Protopolystoma xenopodis TaxID=117903 RepID=A0A3S5CN16_9PLAT|nr:unnamed protein product [Protopolystoma xenopodis]